MSNMKETFRGLATINHVSFQLLIPILIGVGLGIWLDGQFGWSPWATLIGTVLGIAAAFRNLYVWSVQQIRESRNSERTQRAIRELGLQRNQQEEDDGGNE